MRVKESAGLLNGFLRSVERKAVRSSTSTGNGVKSVN